MQATTNGRPKGAKNAKPTRQAIAGYYGLLRNAADNGDINAAGKLLELDLIEQRHAKSE